MRQVRGMCAGVGLLVSFPAGATQFSDDIRFDVPDGCPSQAAFLARVNERMHEAVRAGRVSVSVKKVDEGVLGTLTVETAAGRSVTRTVRADSCGEVVDALALIAALTLRSGAPERVLDADASNPETDSQAPAQPNPPTGRRAVVDEVERDRGLTASTSTPKPVWWFGAGASAERGFGPEWAPGAILTAEIERPGVWSVRVSAGAATTGHVSAAGEAAYFERLGGGVDACGPSLKLALVEVRPCAMTQLGAVYAVGAASETIVAPKGEWRTWLALGPSLRFVGQIGSSRADLWLGAPLALARPTFAFRVEPAIVVHRTPLISPWAAFAVSFSP